MFYPHFQNLNVRTILGGLYFLIFRGEISNEEGCVASHVCELCPKPRRGKGVEMIHKTWCLPSRGLQSRGRAGRGAHSSQGMPEGTGIQLGRRNSTGSVGFPFLKRTLLSLTISQPLCSCSCHFLSLGHFPYPLTSFPAGKPLFIFSGPTHISRFP